MHLARCLPRLLALALLIGCDGDPVPPDSGPPDAGPPPAVAFERDILHVALEVDVTTREATATITLGPSSMPGASFEVGDLEIRSVEDAAGAPLRYEVVEQALHTGLPAAEAPTTMRVSYVYQPHEEKDGVLSVGVTLTWPYHCGNVFPCHSSPANGFTYALALTGVPEGEVAVHASEVSSEGPPYMLAWAVGEYTRLDLGTTTAGTTVHAWHLPGTAAVTPNGVEHLVAVFDWLETSLGPYLYGDDVGSVEAPWSPTATGGLEHHPYWHVGTGSMGAAETHAHEAAHGWFGDGVRIACWEDFVLSEGTVSYLTARALRATAGDEVADALWSQYEFRLGLLDGEIAWPEGCNELDIVGEGSIPRAPYWKGAFFFRALENRVGAAELDAALAAFYLAHREQAARFQDLLDTVEAETGYDPTTCANEWLRSTTVPASDTCP